ncbi:hypothetical protein [Amycolatopsis orientalis]|uniref:hypothetical protein n=1 Tax=Amycolatopsis orientalis TaxID=31958 RepID=UPI0003A1DA4F|nr:hypothetical protein [Amycolatopsis orientalis]
MLDLLKTRPRLVAAIIVAVVFGTGAVLSLTNRSDDETAASSAPASSPAATTSSLASVSPPSSTANPAPLDPAGYQKLLTDLGASITAAAQRLGQTTTAAALKDAGTALDDAITQAVRQLDAATPPDAVRAANRDLITDLNAVDASALPEVINPTFDNKLCGGLSATSVLSRNQAVAGLRDSLAKLATADPAHPYRLGPLFPDPQPEPNRSLANETVITGAGGGKNAIFVKNVSGTDQAVTLADGDYTVYSTGGFDWDAATGRFTRDCSFSKFSVAASMKDNGYPHTNLELTVRKIDPAALPSGLFPEQSAIDPTEYPH